MLVQFMQAVARGGSTQNGPRVLQVVLPSDDGAAGGEPVSAHEISARTLSPNIVNVVSALFLYRFPTDPPGSYRIGMQTTENGEPVIPLGQIIQVTTKIEENNLAKYILERLKGGYALKLDRFEEGIEQKIIDSQVQIIFIDPENINYIVETGIRGDDDREACEFLGQYCESIVTDGNYKRLQEFVEQHEEGINAFADSLRKNKKLKELAKSLEQAA